MHKIHTYVLLNCEEVRPFIWMFDDWIRQTEPCIGAEALDKKREREFASWFEFSVVQGSNDNIHNLKELAQWPMRTAQSYHGYFVNGYKFHTRTHSAGHVTHNSGVCVRGSCYDEFESDYYGLLDEVLEVEYHSDFGRCVVVFFKCHWFNHVQGVRVNRKHNLVDIKHNSKGSVDDPYILASQAEQVYYVSYPSTTKDVKDWQAVVKTKPRGIYEVADCVNETVDDDNVDEEQFLQEYERLNCATTTNEVVEPVNLVTPGEGVIEEPGVNDGDNSDDYGEEKQGFEDEADDGDSMEDVELNTSDDDDDEADD